MVQNYCAISYKDKWAVTNVLELALVVAADKEQAALENADTTEEEISRVAASIEIKCMDKMLFYEGKDPVFEKKYNRRLHQEIQK